MLIEQGKNHSFLYQGVLPDEIVTPEDFHDEHQMMADLTSKFVINEIIPRLEKIEQQRFEETVFLMKKAGELGLISADIPEEDGGLGLGKISATIISEKMALARSFAITFGGQTGIGALPIAYFGTQNQKAEYLPDILSGKKIAAYALTEPSAGTDALSMKTTGVLSQCGNYYVLNGEKQWITNSAFADIFIVFAKVDGRQITAFIVDKSYEGVTTSAEEKKMGLKGSSTRSLILENVKVPIENIIGQIGQGHKIAFNVLNIGRHKISATSLGTAKRAIELAAKHANNRIQFGQPVSAFNLIKNKMADMVIKTFVNESAIYRTAGLMEEAMNEMKETGEDFAHTITRYAVECSINKVMSSEVLDEIVDEAVQIHGGYGYMAEYEIETLYRDSRINRIFEGTNEINRLFIATTVFKNHLELNDGSDWKTGHLQRERQVLQLMKKLYHAAIQSIKKNSLSNFQVEQEIAVFLSDLVITIYAIESAILRTEKLIMRSGEEKNRQKLDCTKVYTHEESQQLALRALNLITHFGDEEIFSRFASRLIMSTPEDSVLIKRKIADIVIEKERYFC